MGGHWAGLSPAAIAGTFTGATNNTPALAAVLQTLAQSGRPGLSDPVLGYLVAYPFGVLGAILAIWMMHRFWWRPAEADAEGLSLVNVAVRVTAAQVAGHTVDTLMREHGWKVVLSRHRRRDGEGTEVPLAGSVIQLDDILVVVGPKRQVEQVVGELGEVAAEQLSLDRSQLDFRRIFVSASEAIGQPG